MRRVIFVGVHNKMGMSPLDPISKSGKMISKCIEAMQGMDLTFERSNLWNTEVMPDLDKSSYTVVYDWAKRVNYCSDDIPVVLGDMTQKQFKKTNIPFVKLGHPASVWSHVKQAEYIEKCKQRILEFAINLNL